MSDPCSYIKDAPKGAATVWCDAPRKRGSSYCTAHHKLTHGGRPGPLTAPRDMVRKSSKPTAEERAEIEAILR